jgi:hypothetical protein
MCIVIENEDFLMILMYQGLFLIRVIVFGLSLERESKMIDL